MPLYKTTSSGVTIGIYNCQRPSAAACKAFTALRRKDRSLKTSAIAVATEGRSQSTIYNVEYARVEDPFFGFIDRPVATKRAEKSGAVEKPAEAQKVASENFGGALPQSEVQIRIPDEVPGPQAHMDNPLLPSI